MSIMSCSEQMCTSPVFIQSRGLCQLHYGRFYAAHRAKNGKIRPEQVIKLTPVSFDCTWCGLTVNLAGVASPGMQRKFCSAKCRNRDSNRNTRMRRQAHTPMAKCLFCSAKFPSRGKSRKYCGPDCLFLANGTTLIGPRLEMTCSLPECDERFERRYLGHRCCSERHGKLLSSRDRRARGLDKRPWDEARQENRERRRARMKGVYVGPKAPRFKIADRDDWLCGLCGDAIPRVVRHGHPLYLTIDHIIPLARGGEHSPSNVQAAHATCNYAKGDRVMAA